MHRTRHKFTEGLHLCPIAADWLYQSDANSKESNSATSCDLPSFRRAASWSRRSNAVGSIVIDICSVARFGLTRLGRKGGNPSASRSESVSSLLTRVATVL